jgi:hypothetical protein
LVFAQSICTLPIGVGVRGGSLRVRNPSRINHSLKQMPPSMRFEP